MFEIRYGERRNKFMRLKNIETLERAKELSAIIEDFAIRHGYKFTIEVWEEFETDKYWIVQSFTT